MPINNITQTISNLPASGRRGVDVQTLFVIKQEDFQDHLQGVTVDELNALVVQQNTMAGAMNSTATQVNTNANTATTQAGIATTKASEASTSASGALTSRNQAETFKNSVGTSASTATTKASEASASALSAVTSASTATTKASEASASALSAGTSASTATTKASEASASALSAGTSASGALTSRNQAETFAQQASASVTSIDVNNLVHRTGAETIAGVKTFSSNIVGNITGNSGTATKLSTTRANYKDITDSAVVGELMWKNFGNYHTIFDASQSTTPTGVAKNNTNPDIAWSATHPTLMGYNGTTTYGVRVDSSRYADRLTGASTITLGGDLSGSVNFDGSANVTLSAQVNDDSHNHTQLYGTISCSSSTGNTYNNSNIMVNGNGPVDTIKPGIGFHQPSLYAGMLFMLDGNTFQFQTQSGQPATLANNITGNAAAATTANTLNISGYSSTFRWAGQGGQPTWLYGGNDPSNAYIYNPSNFSVNYANSATYAATAAVGTNDTQIATTAFVQANKPVINTTTVASATAGLAVGSVGSYAFLRTTVQLPLSTGSTIAGSGLYYSNGQGDAGASPTGTWRLMGAVTSNSGVAGWASLWLRIA